MRVAIIGAFRYDCSLELFLAKGFETLDCEVYRDQGVVGGMDLSVAVKAYWINPDQLSGKRILWWTDHTSRYPEFAELAPKYDLAYTIHDENLQKPGGGEYPFLPCGYDPASCRRIRSRKVWDAVFIGTYRPEREWIRDELLKLRDRGYKVGLFGSGWPDHHNLECGGRIDQNARRAIVASSKVVLNWMYQPMPGQPGPRDTVNMAFFENLAMGAFMMADGSEWTRSNGFEPCRSYVPLAGPPGTAEWVEKWLKRPLRRAYIAWQGREAVRSHTYASRALQMLKDAGLR